MIRRTLLALGFLSTLLAGCGDDQASTTSTSGSSSAAGSTGSGAVMGSALVGLMPKGSGAAFVSVDSGTGSVTELSNTSALTPTDVASADAAIDPNTHRYAAIVSLQNSKPSVATFDATSGAFVSSVQVSGDAFGLEMAGGTLFCLSHGATAGLDTLDPSTGTLTNVAPSAGGTFSFATASNGVDRYYLLSGSDTGGDTLYAWNTSGGAPTSVTIPMDVKYLGAAVDPESGKLVVVTFDVGPSPLVHVASLDPASGLTGPVATLPVTPASTAPEDDVALDDTSYDPATHRLFVVVKAGTPPTGDADTLFTVDVVSGQIVSSAPIGAPAGSVHGLRFNP